MKTHEHRTLTVPQDLHIHTVYSKGDGAVAREQTIELVAQFRHAQIQGISDHLDYLGGAIFQQYAQEVREFGFFVGTEVDGPDWVAQACEVDVDYYIYHCYNNIVSYRGLETLLQTDKPVIIAHPMILETDLRKVPRECLVEINNRYVWRGDWLSFYTPHKQKFRFVIGSDAHQPNWLNQNIARVVAEKLGIPETLVFDILPHDQAPPKKDS